MAPKFLSANFKPDPDKPNDNIRLQNEIRVGLIQMIGGLFVAGGLVVGYLNLKTLQEGQLTDRLTKAVEQLGDEEKSSVRLGGIFSLERIARESERDYVAVMDILCAYVRATENQTHRAEIEAIVRVLGRRESRWDTNVGSRSFNLSHVDLSKLDLSGGNYVGIIFAGTRFSEAKLVKSHFDNADLSECNFDKADLTKAIFNGAHLRLTSFSNSALFEAKLRRADFSGATFQGANLWAADLTETVFTGAKVLNSFLLGATFKRTNIQGADFDGTVVLPAQIASTSGTPARLPLRSAVLKITKTPEGPLSILHTSTYVPIGNGSPVISGEFLALFCDGLGDLQWPDAIERDRYPRTVKFPTVMIDGQPVSVTYAGLSPANPSHYQVNLHVDPELLPGAHLLEISSNNRSAGVEIISVPIVSVAR